MATYFSDNFGPGISLTLAGTEPLSFVRDQKISAGIGGARLRYKRARITIGTAAGIGDIIRFMRFKSSDRLIQVFHGATGGTAGAADFGLYKAGRAHDGALIDVDLFGSAVTIAGGIARADIFQESTNLTTIDRGRTLWELADAGAATYTSDPMEEWDLCATVTTAVTVSLVTSVVEVLYTSGD